jgi:hypothetical protein
MWHLTRVLRHQLGCGTAMLFGTFCLAARPLCRALGRLQLQLQLLPNLHQMQD